MKTLVVANQKGGVGKTADLVHLAFDFMERGLRVVVIDLDTQGNASYSLHEFSSGMGASALFADGRPDELSSLDAEGPAMSLIAADAGLADLERVSLKDAAARLRRNIQALDAIGFDVCLIDTAPSLGNCLAASLLAAEYVISPIELEAYSMQGIEKMDTTIANVRQINPKLQFLGMVPSKVDRRNPRHVQHLEELEGAYPKLVLPVQIGLRSSIADALAQRIPVWKIKKTSARKAAQEVRALAELVFQKMEIAQ